MPIAYLWEGLKLPDNIYDYTGAVLLVPEGEELTKQKLERLMNFNSESKSITTYEASYQVIMEKNQSDPEVKQRALEDQSGYTALKKETDNILKMARCCAQIEDTAVVESAVQDIRSKMEQINLQKLFQFIEVPRPIDENLQRHSLNVSFLNGMMGEWMSFSEEEIKDLLMAGLLHDIGKTKIPEQILNAPRALTGEELEIIRHHPIYSYELLGQEFDEQIRLAVRHHHEKVEGNGYPDNLKGEQISVLARITAVSDVYDAMVSKRSYKEAKIPFDILEQFSNQVFEGLDEDMVTVFLTHMKREFIGKSVVMSDGNVGVVKYIPPNDLKHPIIQVHDLVKQTDNNWYCIQIA